MRPSEENVFRYHIATNRTLGKWMSFHLIGELNLYSSFILADMGQAADRVRSGKQNMSCENQAELGCATPPSSSCVACGL